MLAQGFHLGDMGRGATHDVSRAVGGDHFREFLHSDHNINQINLKTIAIWNIVNDINGDKQMSKNERS